MKEIQFQFEGFDEIHQSEEWCLESTAEETRSRLGIPIWIDYKIIKDAHSKPHPAASAAVSAVRNSIKRTVVSPAPRKRAPKPKTSVVPEMLDLVGKFNATDLMQEAARDLNARSTPSIPPSMD